MSSVAGSSKHDSKAVRKSLIASLDLVSEGDRPLRRSRTGCLTCRKRKKKCPEQYEASGACIRCKAGGWKCVRENHMMNTKQAGSGTSVRSEGSDSPPSRSAVVITNAEQPLTSQIPLSSTNPPAGPVNSSSVNISTDNSQDVSGLIGSMVNDDDVWMGQSLDSILGASLPEFDMSIYDFNSTENFSLSPNWDTIMNSGPGPSFNFGNTIIPPATTFNIAEITSQNWTFPAQLMSTSNEKCDEGLLIEFHTRFVLPAWSITYPEPVRSAIVYRYHEVTNSHQVTRLCKQAAAAVYIDLLIKKYRCRIQISRNIKDPVDLLDAKFMAASFDTEEILREATLLARSPKDDNLTMEVHCWALHDLHMAVGAFCESNRAYAIMDIAERLISLTHGPHPEVYQPQTHLPFYLRAFAMADLNRSIAQRRHTFFTFGTNLSFGSPSFAGSDASHDMWFGLPGGLIIPLAAIANMIADRGQSSSVSRPSPQALENALLTFHWPHQPGTPLHPREWSAEMAVEVEIWRNLSLIMLWRWVNGQQVLADPLCKSIRLVLDLLKSLPILSASRISSENNPIDFWSSFYTTATFLVGSLLIDRDDRAFCRRYLQQLGEEKALEDMLVALEVTWTATDKAGYVVDWFEECSKAGLTPCFF